MLRDSMKVLYSSNTIYETLQQTCLVNHTVLSKAHRTENRMLIRDGGYDLQTSYLTILLRYHIVCSLKTLKGDVVVIYTCLNRAL